MSYQTSFDTSSRLFPSRLTSRNRYTTHTTTSVLNATLVTFLKMLRHWLLPSPEGAGFISPIGTSGIGSNARVPCTLSACHEVFAVQTVVTRTSSRTGCSTGCSTYRLKIQDSCVSLITVPCSRETTRIRRAQTHRSGHQSGKNLLIHYEWRHPCYHFVV